MVKNGDRCDIAPPLNCWKVRPPNQLLISDGVPENVAGLSMSTVHSWPSVSPTTAMSKKLSKLVSTIETGAAIEPML